MKNVSDYFEEQVNRIPTKTAIEDRHSSLSYKELNELSTNIATRLQADGVGSGDSVILCLNRSINTVAAMIAINKIGGCYVPVDPTYPDAVLNSQAELSEARVAIVSVKHNWVVPKGPISSIDIDELVRPIETGESFSKVDKANDSPIYIMYTSGSTGDPKGVVIPERSVIRLAKRPSFMDIKKGETFLLHSPLTFDASTFEIWTPLLNGEKLVVYETERFDPNQIITQVREQGVTVLWLTAAIFHFAVSYTIELFENLRVIISGGDVLKSKIIHRVFDYYPGIIVINGYGPTENTTFTCCHIMTDENRPGDNVPIGHPISGTEIKILDEMGIEVEEGTSGELVVSGDGVALGYLNPGKKNNTFYEDADGKFCYRTGDIVRELRSNGIEFIGRNDRLVKIRGHRISLDEVANTINKLDDVDECVALVTEDISERKLLTALVQSKSHEELSEVMLKSLLKHIIPSYMIPDKIYIYSELPITRNGKVDRKPTSIS